MRRILILLLLPALVAGAGCGRRSAPQKPAVPREALNAGGEPQWSAQVRGDRLSFTDGGAVALAAKVTRADHGGEGVVWSGPLAPATAGQPSATLTLTTLRKACQDADTGMTYPLTAIVETGGHRYAGCAAPPGQGLGPRR
jgi:uncharacterized membrane protein